MSNAAAAASGLGALLGFKGDSQVAQIYKQTAEYEAKVREQEAVLLARAKVDEEATLRRNAERHIATQNVQRAASGITLSGSPLYALRDSYFAAEKEALRIQYASDIEQTKAKADATLIRAEGRARSKAQMTRAYANLLNSGSKAYEMSSFSS